MGEAEPLRSATGVPNGRIDSDRSRSDRPLVADLLALRELQASLSLEESDEAVVRIGTNAIVEILALDGGAALIDPSSGRPEIRSGWRQGRSMPQHEIDALARALDRELKDVRGGRSSNLMLAGRSAGAGTGPAVPAAVRALGFASVLILGLGSGGRRTGALILASRDEEAFSGEQTILAEILASQMSEQCERVRVAEEMEAIEPRVRREVGEATKVLRARNTELEAQAAIASAAALSFDSDRQVELVLRKAMELTRHCAGAIYLVETNESGDDLLRFARGLGDPAWLELARLPRWRRGEGLAGRVWESGEAAAFDDMADDPAGLGREILHRAGYRRLCCQPLRARGRTIGVLELFGDESRPYDATERGLLRAIADQVALAIHNARLLGDVMRHSLDLELQLERLTKDRGRGDSERRALFDLLSAAAASMPIEDRVASMLPSVLGLVPAEAVALHAREAGTGALRLLAQEGFSIESAEAFRTPPAEDPVLSPSAGGASGAPVDLADGARLKGSAWTRRIGFRHLIAASCGDPETAAAVLTVATRYSGSLGESARADIKALAGLFALVLHPAEAAGSQVKPSLEAPAEWADAPPPSSPGLRVQAQKMESLGTLAPDIAHEFNNTIGAIMGHASHIRSLVPDYNPVHGKAAVIVEQSQRAADLVRQVLTFARGGSGRHQAIDIAPLIEETLDLLTRTLGPSIAIEARCPAHLPPVEADAGQLRQAFLNLAVNARDAMPGGGRLVFEARAGHIGADTTEGLPGLAPGDYVSIVVRDSGTGMSPEVLEHVFEPFFTTKPMTQGSGLGLTVVQDILREHGGDVTLSSAPGVGTAVRLYIPVCAARKTDAVQTGRDAAGAPDRSARFDPGGEGFTATFEPSMDELCAVAASTLDLVDETPKDGGKTGSGPWLRARSVDGASQPARILVVDDEPVLRDMTAEMLRSRGYDVLVASDGVEALDIYRREWGRIGLVLLDMIMPRLGGLETCRRLIGMDRAARILLCSGYSHNQQAQQAVREGAVGLLPKPFGMSELFGWVERGLRPPT